MTYEWERYIGRVVSGRYTLKSFIGGGGFGGVFFADEKQADNLLRSVAIKLFVPDHRVDTARQLDEIKINYLLDHPHILRSYTSGEETIDSISYYYLVMEVAEASLDTILSNKQMVMNEIEELILHVASALHYIHNQETPITHRDIKPGNILLKDRQWKISDFGISRKIEKSDYINSRVMGSFLYMPPEGFKGIISPYWDVWSFGVLIQYIITGKYPYDDELPVERYIYNIMNCDPYISDQLPCQYRNIVEGCLRKEMRERISMKDILQILNLECIIAPEGSTTHTGRKYIQRLHQIPSDVRRYYDRQ